MGRPFNISLCRGDTKKVTAGLSIDGEAADLAGYTVKIYQRSNNAELMAATVSGTVATFDITKEISAQLPVGLLQVMIVFESNTQRVSQPGFLYVNEGVLNNGL